MTTPVTIDYDRLENIRIAALNKKAKRDWARRQPPLMRLFNGSWEMRGVVRGEVSTNVKHVLNDTGSCEVTLLSTHHLAVWAQGQRYQDRNRNVHITIDYTGSRWAGRLSELKTEVTEDGTFCTMTFMSDIEELKHILCWPNPFSPAALQFPRVWGLAMPSVSALKLTLMVNLMRLQGNLWALPDDPLNFDSWLQGMQYKEWPILVKPQSLFLDDSPWTIVQARFDTFYDIAKPIVDDGQLMLDLRRWLPGDPQPWPGANLYRPGQLIVDIVDKSGWWDQTAVGGTIVGGLVRDILTIGDDLVDDMRQSTGSITNPEEYAVSGFLGVSPKQPWVVYRNDGRPNGIRTADEVEVTWTPATVTQVVTGGTSMPGVQEAFEATIQTIGSLMATFMMVPNLAEPALTLLKPLFEDTILAFQSFKHPTRGAQLGWSHYFEDWGGETTAYTLSGVLATRQAVRNTRDKVAASAKVSDGSPYLIGDRGEGHYFLGDRIGIQDPTSQDGRVIVEQVAELELSWDADTPHEWKITIGERNIDRDPVTRITDKTKQLGSLIKEAGLM